jgi:1,2-diacylglycerol 3-alpha-glucosyltransferase
LLKEPPSNGARVAIIFNRFGPYHHARLNAAGKCLSVWGIEACASEDVYAWTKVEGASAFTRVTLTERHAGNRQWQRELRRKMWQTLDEIKPDAVAIPGWIYADALSALAWCVRTRTPVTVMTESTVWDEPRKGWKEWIKSRLVKLCSAGLAGGTPHAEYLGMLGLPKDRIFLGYDIVDNEYFAARSAEAKSRESEVRKNFQLPEKFFLASARFIEKKNLFRLLDAYARYREAAKGEGKSEPWGLVLLGDGELRADIAARVAALGLRDHVILPGFKQYDELPAYFGLAGVFIHPSTTEQWGLVVNEAMACGLPVVVSNRCGCAQDLVRDGVNGFTFDPNDVEALAGLLRKTAAPDFPLPAFGTESRRLIAAWGPERFASGIHDAVVLSLKNSVPRATLIDRLLLRLLLERRA